MSQPLGGTAIKPKGWDRTGWEAFKYMIYNPDTGAVLTRTPLSWAKIIVFYCIYYTLLAGFWLACLNIFFLTIDDDKPRWQLDESLIGSNPGVGIKPVMYDEKIDSSMYTFYLDDKDNTPTDKDGEGPKNIDYSVRMKKFLEKYDKKKGLHECTDNSDSNKGKCIFDTADIGACGQENFGYMPENGAIKPCVLLKLNKIYGFDPKPVDANNITEYKLMSDGLKSIIEGGQEPDSVFFDCFGRYPADREAVQLEYFPKSQAISRKFFPFTGGNYHSPVVAVQITSKTPGQLIHMECRAYYKDVIHNTKDRLGLVQFEIFIDEHKPKKA